MPDAMIENLLGQIKREKLSYVNKLDLKRDIMNMYISDYRDCSRDYGLVKNEVVHEDMKELEEIVHYIDTYDVR